MDTKKIEKYFKRRVNDNSLLLIRPKFTYNIGKYQIYLSPAEIYDSGKLYHQLMITEFNSSDIWEKAISHKTFYVEEGVDILLPSEKREQAVKEIYSWPEHCKFDGRKSESSSGKSRNFEMNTFFMH